MLLLVDLGYLLFYRLHATRRWLAHQQANEEHDLIDTCRRHLMSQLRKLKQTHKRARKIVFCKDERRDNVWRKALFPDYKGTRVRSAEEADVLHALYPVVLEVASEFGPVVGGDGLEADDVAYLLVQSLRSRERDGQLEPEDVVIVTTDRDYLQLVDEHVKLVDATGKEFGGSGAGAQVDMWTKVLTGDVSDNIPPVHLGCGKKTAARLAAEGLEAINEYVARKGCADALQRNVQLICMDRIPQELATAFLESNSI